MTSNNRMKRFMKYTFALTGILFFFLLSNYGCDRDIIVVGSYDNMQSDLILPMDNGFHWIFEHAFPVKEYVTDSFYYYRDSVFQIDTLSVTGTAAVNGSDWYSFSDGTLRRKSLDGLWIANGDGSGAFLLKYPAVEGETYVENGIEVNVLQIDARIRSSAGNYPAVTYSLADSTAVIPPGNLKLYMNKNIGLIGGEYRLNDTIMAEWRLIKFDF